MKRRKNKKGCWIIELEPTDGAVIFQDSGSKIGVTTMLSGIAADDHKQEITGSNLSHLENVPSIVFILRWMFENVKDGNYLLMIAKVKCLAEITGTPEDEIFDQLQKESNRIALELAKRN
jgi:hypothetical protein